MPRSPDLDDQDLVAFRIESDGQPIPDDVLVIELQVRRAIGAIPGARIVIADGDVATGEWAAADSNVFRPGAEIAIAAGYGSTLAEIFAGVVVKVETQVSGETSGRLVVECRDKAVAMTIGRRNAIFHDQKDSAAIAALIGAHGLKADVASTSIEHRNLVQHYCTDWDFMLARAEANGRVVTVDAGAVSVQAPATGASAALKLTYGADIIEFQAEIDARTQLRSVEASAWDPKSQAMIAGQAAPPRLNAQGNLDAAALAKVCDAGTFRLQSGALLDQSSIAAWSEAQQLKAGLARIRGRVRFQGSALAKPGTVMEIAGVGARYEGKVYVSAVEHDLRDGNWTTEARFGLDPRWFTERADVVAPVAAGLLPGVEGLHIGKVTKLAGDPLGERRIEIELPVLAAEQPKIWARLMQCHASSGFGALFLPEIGDEVLVGFLNHDPSHPVVLGSLYSSARAAAYPFADENDVKAVVTRCMAKIEFNDADKVITVTTPAGNRVVLSDKDKSILVEDQNKNRIELATGGITIESPQDIRISAKGKIAIDAVGAISSTSQSDVTSAGLNVACDARIGFTAKGSASAELSATGQTTVKGALVMIN